MKDIEGFYGYYVDELGNVFGNRKHKSNPNEELRKMKPSIGSSGYLVVTLMINGKKHSKNVHRLVAKAFVPNPENKPQVNHINGIKIDNRIENLEWNTRSENIRHSFNIGLSGKGSRHGMSKLTEAQVLLIRSDYRSLTKIALEYNINPTLVSLIKSKKIWKHI